MAALRGPSPEPPILPPPRRIASPRPHLPLGASPRLLLPLFPLQPAPPHCGPNRPGIHLGSCGPTLGARLGAHEAGARRGLRLHLVRGLENFKSSGPAHQAWVASPGPAGQSDLESHWAVVGVGGLSQRNRVLVSLREFPHGVCVCLFVCVINGKQGRGRFIPKLVPWCMWAAPALPGESPGRPRPS